MKFSQCALLSEYNSQRHAYILLLAVKVPNRWHVTIRCASQPAGLCVIVHELDYHVTPSPFHFGDAGAVDKAWLRLQALCICLCFFNTFRVLVANVTPTDV
jgi:hypothetical protein